LGWDLTAGLWPDSGGAAALAVGSGCEAKFDFSPGFRPILKLILTRWFVSESGGVNGTGRVLA
jgi:hypothetical protein